MHPQLVPYAFMNVFGSFLVVVIVIFYVFYVKGKLKPRIFKTVLVIFSIVMLAYGIYQLAIADILRRVYPGKYYTIGGWIAIFLGIIPLVIFFWNLKKNKNRRE